MTPGKEHCCLLTFFLDFLLLVLGRQQNADYAIQLILPMFVGAAFAK